MKRICLMVLCATFAIGLSVRSASALPAFKKAFTARYVTNSGNDDFIAAAKKASCNACHVKGKKKNVRNAYGEELAKLIEGDAKDRLAEAKEKGQDASDAEKAKIAKELQEAFTKVESVKSDSGKAYGEILKSGNLP